MLRIVKHATFECLLLFLSKIPSAFKYFIEKDIKGFYEKNSVLKYVEWPL